MAKEIKATKGKPKILQEWQKSQKRKDPRAKKDSRFFEAMRSLTLWLWQHSWPFALVMAVLLAMALYSYCPTDPAFSNSTPDLPVNLLGFAGAWVADFLLWLLGFSAWWIVLGLTMVVIFAARSLYRRHAGETAPERLNPPKLSAAFGFCVLLLGSTCLEALRLRRFEAVLPGAPGGVLGDTMAFGIAHFVGVGLATVLFFVLIAIGLSLLMDFLWVDIAERIGSLIYKVLFQPLLRSRDKKIATEVLQERTERFERRVKEGRSNGPLTIHQPEVSSNPEPRLFEAPIGDGVRALPSLALLADPPEKTSPIDNDTIEFTSRLIVSKLKSFGVDALVRGAQAGPVITQFWLEPGTGVKGTAIENVTDDLRRALGVTAVRFVNTVPGTSYVGLEVPNPERQIVRLKEILSSEVYEKSKSLLTLALGKDIAGKPVVVELTKLPHLLVGGTTGSGKSVGVNAMILSMLYRTDPSQLRLVLIDPKMLEFSLYDGIPNLLCPVVTDMNKATVALKWLVNEMERRYSVMSKIGVRNFESYNERVRQAQAKGEPLRDPFVAQDDPNASPLETWPYIVCIVDELADLILTNRKEVEQQITRLAQKARAAGMHLILATQRPSADVVTSLIKANVPARISFQVASRYDAIVILGERGAEELLGYGDMLYRKPGMAMTKRIQGCYVDEEEVSAVVDELKKYGPADYLDRVTEDVDDEEGSVAYDGSPRSDAEKDELYDQAVQIVLTTRRATISFVQRQLNIGYNRAANILEAMEAAGIVSAANTAGRRVVLVPERDDM